MYTYQFTAETLRIASYSCRNVNTSVENIRQLCDNNDLIFLQETWLTDEDLTELMCMHVDFYADGVSSMTPDREILSGRPFSGLGIMWRKSLGSCITIEKYDDHRLMAVHFDNGSCKLLAVNIYMPYDDRSVRSSNYDEYINYLGVVHAIIQESAASNIMIIGDWNANVNNNAIFGAELISFCEEHGYIISDVDKLGLESGAFTYLSESHGTTSWIDHCVCTVQAHAAVSSLEINYDVQSSDHYPLSICVDVNHIPKVETTMQHSTAKCNWGKATESQLSEYTTHCETLITSDVSLDCEAIYCTNTACSDPNHKHSIETLYGSIVSSLHNAADGNIPTNDTVGLARMQSLGGTSALNLLMH